MKFDTKTSLIKVGQEQNITVNQAIYKCMDKHEDYDGKILSYSIVSLGNGKKIIRTVPKSELRRAMINNEIVITNLRLTSDYKITDRCEVESVRLEDSLTAEINKLNLMMQPLKKLKPHMDIIIEPKMCYNDTFNIHVLDKKNRVTDYKKLSDKLKRYNRIHLNFNNTDEIEDIINYLYQNMDSINSDEHLNTWIDININNSIENDTDNKKIKRVDISYLKDPKYTEVVINNNKGILSQKQGYKPIRLIFQRTFNEQGDANTEIELKELLKLKSSKMIPISLEIDEQYVIKSITIQIQGENKLIYTIDDTPLAKQQLSKELTIKILKEINIAETSLVFPYYKEVTTI